MGILGKLGKETFKKGIEKAPEIQAVIRYIQKNGIKAAYRQYGKAAIDRFLEVFPDVRRNKGGPVTRKPREFAAGGMYKGKKHMYAAGGKVMDTPKKKPRRKK
jgi:hypothetical protein